MTHLLDHIVKEINILGHVFLHNMFPFERMCELHQWYLKACAEGYIMLAARIKHTHFYWGMDDIWIDFDHFLFLFHKDA